MLSSFRIAIIFLGISSIVVAVLSTPAVGYADSAFNPGVVKFTCADGEPTLIERGAAVVTQGEARIYIGTHQATSNNQNPVIGPKVGVIVRLDPTTGMAQQGTYLSATLQSGNTNTLTVKNFCLTATGTLVVQSETAHWPRYANRNPMNDVMGSASNGFNHWIEFTPNLTGDVTAYGEDRANPTNHAGTMPAEDCFSAPLPTRTPDPTLTEKLFLPLVRR